MCGSFAEELCTISLELQVKAVKKGDIRWELQGNTSTVVYVKVSGRRNSRCLDLRQHAVLFENVLIFLFSLSPLRTGRVTTNKFSPASRIRTFVYEYIAPHKSN
jgi:hypothetical protein